MFCRFKNFYCVLLLALLPLWATTPAAATEMVYTPLNPSFGGNPNNAPGLMSTAQAQNGFTAPVLSPLASFNLSLQRAILSRLTSQSLTTMFGANNTLGTLEKTYDTVGYIIKVTPDAENSTVTITTTDKTSGAVATFVINSAPTTTTP
jgi:curli production assembly/transport component CsgF